MKYFLCILFIVIGIKHVFAAEWIHDISGMVTKEELLINNKISISTFKIVSQWTDNLGHYGSSICIGFIERHTDGEIKNLQNSCERIDENGIKYWTRGERAKSQLKAGVGYSHIIDSTSPYRDELIGTKCTYAINYLNNLSFSKTKCELSDDLLRKLSN